MIKSKKKMFVVIGVFALVLMIGTVTYAFFNYTRTGAANTIRAGRIVFVSRQTDTINLTNLFPIDPTETGIMDDDTKVGTLTIEIEGDTGYHGGVEYLISATNVTNTVGTKTIPISISAVASGTLGTSDDSYFDNRDTATSHIYKVLAKDTISNNDQLMVGYIANNATGINGTITIKAYINKDNILISDTYPEGEEVINGVTYYNGTPTTNKTVFTTEEWNSLNTTGISFKVKVEANEGIWVDDLSRENVMNLFQTNSSTIYNERLNITKIYFNQENQSDIDRKYSSATIKDDLTYNNQGSVKGWLEDDPDNDGKYILYVESNGKTKLTTCANLFQEFKNVEYIEFNNVDTSDVTDMSYMFSTLDKLTSLDLSSLDTSNVTTMEGMFGSCTGLTFLDLSSFNTEKLINTKLMFSKCSEIVRINIDNFKQSNLQNMFGMFMDCSKLQSVNLTGLNTSNVATMENLFYNCSSLTSIDISSFNTSNVTNMNCMFYGCSELVTVYVSDLWVISNGTSTTNMFINARKIVGEDGTTFSWDHFLDGEWARVDDLPDNPGYFTYLKTPTSLNSTNQIALTFDDGPSSTTTKILNLLEQYHSKATFFLVGNNINNDDNLIITRAYNMGCELGNHSRTHTDMTGMTSEEISSEISYVDSFINPIIGQNSKYFRPPYLKTNSMMFNTINKIFISGYVTNDDSSSTSITQLINNILDNAQDGAIILMHDFENNDNTVEALKVGLPRLISQGYEFVTLTELFNQKHIIPNSNLVYNRVKSYNGSFDSNIFTGNTNTAVINKNDFPNINNSFELQVHYSSQKPPILILQQWGGSNGDVWKEVNPSYYSYNTAYFHSDEIIKALDEINLTINDLSRIAFLNYNEDLNVTSVDVYK